MNDIVVVQDKKGGIRVLTNPKSLYKYRGAENAIVNPENLHDLLKKGIGPSRWAIKSGKLCHRPLGQDKNVATLKGHHKGLIRKKGFKWSSIILWSGLSMPLLALLLYMVSKF